jgi:hypothetical protein
MGKRHYTPGQIVGKLSDELLTGEIASTLKEAQILIGRWQREYNPARPHDLGYRPPRRPCRWRPEILAIFCSARITGTRLSMAAAE